MYGDASWGEVEIVRGLATSFILSHVMVMLESLASSCKTDLQHLIKTTFWSTCTFFDLVSSKSSIYHSLEPPRFPTQQNHDIQLYPSLGAEYVELYDNCSNLHLNFDGVYSGRRLMV